MVGLSFIHCADLHLGRPFTGVGGIDDIAVGQLSEAPFQAWERIVDLALSKQVDMVLAAGDIYDIEGMSLAARVRFRAGCSRLSDAGIACYVVRGNHDPLYEDALSMPEEVHVFPAGTVTSIVHERDGEPIAVIHGISHDRKGIREDLSAGFHGGEGPYDIGLLHCHLGGQVSGGEYAPCTMDGLLAAGMDYWALGHVHSTMVRADGGVTVAYPGTPQGRGMVESGPRGCLLVTVNNGITAVEAMDLAPWKWGRVRVDLSGCLGPEAVMDAIQTAIDDLSTGTVFRIEIVGRTNLEQGAVKQIFEGIGPGLPKGVIVGGLDDRTHPAVDMDHLAERDDAIGDLARCVLQAQQGDAAANAIRSLADVPGSSAVLKHLDIDDPWAKDALSRALWRAMDLMGGDV